MTRPYNRITPELMERLLVRIAAGETARSLGADPALPSANALRRWLKARPEMEARYQDACARRTRVMRRRMPRQGGGRDLVLVYTEALAEKICDEVGRGMVIRQILAQPGMPSHKTLFAWLDRHPDFARRYAFACHVRAEALADEVVAIADSLDDPDPPTADGAPRTIRARQAQARRERTRIKRAELMIAVRKHLSAAMTPKRYRWEWMQG